MSVAHRGAEVTEIAASGIADFVPSISRRARSAVVLFSLRMRQAASGRPCALLHSPGAARLLETCACSPKEKPIDRLSGLSPTPNRRLGGLRGRLAGDSPSGGAGAHDRKEDEGPG